MRLSWVLALTGAMCGSAMAQEAPSVQQQVEQMVKAEQDWGAATSTQGMKLMLVEGDRTPANSYQTGSGKDEHFGPMISYNLQVQGAPKNLKWNVTEWQAGTAAPTKIGHNVTLDSHGTAICAGSMRSGCQGDESNRSTINVKERPLPGEPVRIGMSSDDGSVSLFAQVVPFPIDAKNHGCRVEAVVLMKGASVVLMKGSGFAPGETVTVITKNKEEETSTVTADEKGNVSQAVFPKVPGEAKGTAKVTLKGAKCAPAVGVPWGM